MRIICVETESGAAANIGGPVHVSYHTFDVLDGGEAVERWLNEPIEKGWRYSDRSIVGVEYERATKPDAAALALAADDLPFE